jgi:hypothetical protein
MRFHHAVLLAALAIATVCAERIKVSDERGIIDSTLSAVAAWIAAAAVCAPAAAAAAAAAACGATTLDNGSDRGGSRDRGEASNTSRRQRPMR